MPWSASNPSRARRLVGISPSHGRDGDFDARGGRRPDGGVEPVRRHDAAGLGRDPQSDAPAAPKIVWKKSAAASVPERQWKKAGFNTTMSTVLLTGNHVYGVSVYGETCCLDAADGSRVWTTLQPTSGGTEPHDRWCSAFFVPHGDKVFIFNERGDLILGPIEALGL